MSRTRLAPLTLIATVLAAALLLPAAARADDRSFATTAIDQAGRLARYESATGTALTRVDRRGRAAIPAARRAVQATRNQIDKALRPLRGESTSTADGARIKRRFVALLVAEKKTYGTVDRSLAAFQRGEVSTGNELQRRAKASIAKIRKQAMRLAPALRRLVEGA
ncbi:hypothetical protein VSS74_19055 [Conexibacter stalactiti]|uniref:DUF4142 domain-containing protein n=1 Tax=Conexibacter stalactiti TaxID=1940611 RepID=A0ABU4HTD2_9ACTN|nr:hypothetical protein [Conexibacter stalactiti]MDW5596454.1 hypothetical protein [Conexibacter stalactiti]MEC5037096.1 hypothetical protein [Conexibacter stalactiti]